MFQILPQNVDPRDYSTETVTAVMISLIKLILQLGAVAAVAMIIWGGFLYISSFGNAAKADQGKKTLTYAIVGLIIIIVAQVVINFIVCDVFGVDQSVCNINLK